MPRGSVHAHTGRLRPVVSRVDTSGGSVHLHTGRLRSGVTWGDTRIASAVLVPDFRVNPVPCIASAVLESSTVPTGWPRSYTVCGPTYPITGQKSEGESQRGIDMCVWLCFPAGCRLCAAPQRVCHFPVCGSAAAAGGMQPQSLRISHPQPSTIHSCSTSGFNGANTHSVCCDTVWPRMWWHSLHASVTGPYLPCNEEI